MFLKSFVTNGLDGPQCRQSCIWHRIGKLSILFLWSDNETLCELYDLQKLFGRLHLSHWSLRDVVTILTHWGRDNIDAISQTTFSRTFSGMKVFEFLLTFQWNLFLRVKSTIFQHWFRYWLGADQVTTHYLNQWLFILLTHICITRPQWVKGVNTERMSRINFMSTSC